METVEKPQELEELDVAEVLEGIKNRLVGLELALSGCGLERRKHMGMWEVLHDALFKVEELQDQLEQQDKTKRARGEPRAARIFLNTQKEGC